MEKNLRKVLSLSDKRDQRRHQRRNNIATRELQIRRKNIREALTPKEKREVRLSLVQMIVTTSSVVLAAWSYFTTTANQRETNNIERRKDDRERITIERDRRNKDRKAYELGKSVYQFYDKYPIGLVYISDRELQYLKPKDYDTALDASLTFFGSVPLLQELHVTFPYNQYAKIIWHKSFHSLAPRSGPKHYNLLKSLQDHLNALPVDIDNRKDFEAARPMLKGLYPNTGEILWYRYRMYGLVEALHNNVEIQADAETAAWVKAGYVVSIISKTNQSDMRFIRKAFIESNKRNMVISPDHPETDIKRFLTAYDANPNL